MSHFGTNSRPQGPVWEWADLAVSTHTCTLKKKKSKDLHCVAVRRIRLAMALQARSIPKREAVDGRLRERTIMNTPAAPPTHFPTKSVLIVKYEIPSNTKGGPDWLGEDHPRWMPPSANSTAFKFLTLDEVCDWYIRCTLQCFGGNRDATAQVLGIGRTTLYRYLKKLNRE